MLSHLLRTLFAIVCLLSVGGCKLLKDKPPTNYQTVAADPRYDTELAETEHAAALRVIDRYYACAACERDCMEAPDVRLTGFVNCYIDCTFGDLALAEEHLNRALVADVKYGPAHNTLGTVYYLQGRLYLAAWEYEYASRLMPGQIEPIYNLGMVYEAAGKLEEAIHHFERAHHFEPQNPYVIGSLARAWMRYGATIDDVRFLLEDIVFYDTRPQWVEWAQDTLGVHPRQKEEPAAEPRHEGRGMEPQPQRIPPPEREPGTPGPAEPKPAAPEPAAAGPVSHETVSPEPVSPKPLEPKPAQAELPVAAPAIPEPEEAGEAAPKPAPPEPAAAEPSSRETVAPEPISFKSLELSPDEPQPPIAVPVFPEPVAPPNVRSPFDRFEPFPDDNPRPLPSGLPDAGTRPPAASGPPETVERSGNNPPESFFPLILR